MYGPMWYTMTKAELKNTFSETELYQRLLGIAPDGEWTNVSTGGSASGKKIVDAPGTGKRLVILGYTYTAHDSSYVDNPAVLETPTGGVLLPLAVGTNTQTTSEFGFYVYSVMQPVDLT